MKRWLIVIVIIIILLSSVLGFTFISQLNKENKNPKMELKSPVFEEKIPSRYTCDGENINPELTIENIPDNCESLALIVDDLDAPGKTFVHWVVFNIEPTSKIEENSVPGIEGKNDFGKVGYGGPCPPSGVHRYKFKLYALDSELQLEEGATKQELLGAMEEHILDKAELIGKYTRK